MFYWIGPNGPAPHGSILPDIEWHTQYMFKVITIMQRTFIRSLVPSLSATEEALVHTQELLKRTAWSSACSSWFKNGETHGAITAIWPGISFHYFEIMRKPRFEDFNIEYAGNRLSYWGNGYTSTELGDAADPVCYFDVLERELKEGNKAFWT
ncbi:hypothetical protein LTR17_018355 [Elasticomyces elasticus]|nr:hypothetical protein LTR17_018355 [Elasticomyces elasticus]